MTHDRAKRRYRRFAMKIVVFGSGGLVGRYVVRELLARGEDDVLALPRSACDITRRADVNAATNEADRIVNCAAYTDVEHAEDDEDTAYRVNTLGAENLARAAARHDASLVHISTDLVFDGEKPTPYDELDVPRPVGAYARSKWAGEVLAREATPRLFVVRVQGVYGEGGKGFASKLPRLVLGRGPITADGERLVQPTWARTVARHVCDLLHTDAYGTYHVSAKGKTTWADFAHAIAKRLDLPSLTTGVPTATLKTRAIRPKNALFLHRMLALRGFDRLPTWEEDLDAYLAHAGLA